MDLVSGLTLPDPDDRHILAAAIVAKAEVIVTFNEKDFPKETLAAYQVRPQPPDDFVGDLISLDLPAVCRAVKNQRVNLRNPPVDAATLLDTLRQQGLPNSVSQLQLYMELL